MESIKRLDEILKPDFRNSIRSISIPGQAPRPVQLEDIHSWISDITLNENVPEGIRTQFAQAQNLGIYAWFCYQFHTTSELAAFSAVEMALKHKYNSRSTFANLIKRAAQDELITDQGFSVGRNREPDGRRYVDVLSEVMPQLRNDLAHGSTTIHPFSYTSLHICADFINQVFHADA